MLDDEANAQSAADPMDGVSFSGVGAAKESATGAVTLSGWNLGAQQSAPLPTAVSAEVVTLRANLWNLGIPVPLGMNDVSQLLAFAAHHTPGASKQGGAGPSLGL